MLKKLNNMKIQKRLVVCFIIVVAMASISGLLGIVLLIRADSNYSKALVENGFSQGEIGTFNTYLNKGGAVVRDIIVLTDEQEIKDAVAELESIQTSTTKAFEDLKVNCQTPEELAYITIIEEKLPLYRELREKVTELGLANHNEEALDLFRTEARPVLNEVMSAAESLRDLNVTFGNSVSASLTFQSNATVVIILVVIVLTICLSIIFAFRIAKSFSTPILQVRDASMQLAEGMLDIQIEINTEDEVGEMARSFAAAATMMKGIIQEVSRCLSEIAANNFDISTNAEFKGDFKEIQTALDTIVVSLSETMRQINESSSQVAMGAEQMSESAQSLAEGATEQAGAVEELTATIENVTMETETSAQNAIKSYERAKEYEQEAEIGNEQMKQLIQAMGHISETSKKIENIIAEIEDIASQTNLLSLNASIEAARAGEAGKGFAVVADQIGKLASDSAKSAVNTRELIGTSINEIESGNLITRKTSEALEKVISGIKILAESSRESSEMSSAQAETMKQVELGIEQISSVVQMNSAAAQETSATSEELSAQSENLRALVEQFRLKE